MGKVISIRQLLQDAMETVTDKVNFEETKDDTEFPYVVYNLPNSIDFGDLEVFDFDVDFWDDSQDTTAIETLADNIDAVLHKKKFAVTDVVAFVVYRINRINVEEDEENIRHKTYTYRLRSYTVY